MSGSINKVILIGRLGKDPEMKYTPGGAPVAKFTLATDEEYKDKSGEKQKRTEWHTIVAWNRLGEICKEYLTKGKQVYVEGSIRSHQWEDNNGQKHTAYEIVAREMKMLGSREGGNGAVAGNSHYSQEPAHAAPETPRNSAPVQRDEFGNSASLPTVVIDDDVPF
jgi:single-strand DNA-binding protein